MLLSQDSGVIEPVRTEDNSEEQTLSADSLESTRWLIIASLRD